MSGYTTLCLEPTIEVRCYGGSKGHLTITHKNKDRHMTTTYLHGNARIQVDYKTCYYALQQPHGGEHGEWLDILHRETPEDFLVAYLKRNLNRIEHQPKKVSQMVRLILGALVEDNPLQETI
jgi:hypothetical protein